MLANLDSLGYAQMTPIQAQSLPVILKGMDLIAQAKTGSGKTAAFGIGLLNPINPRFFGCQALVICPTRELADQVAKEIRRLARAEDNIKVLTLCGGVSFGPQIGSLEHGAHIIVGTPGRIQQHLRKGSLVLDGLNTLVLDEADRMLDMGFIRDIKKVLAVLPPKRQNLLFSATFSEEIKALADGLLNKPAMIEVARRNSTVEVIKQKIHPVDRDKKHPMLSYLIKSNNWTQVLVFTRTKHGANKLVEQLGADGIGALAIHGNKSQSARTRALSEFKDGTLQVLVATDIAARGIDIDQLPHVVNYDLPNIPEDYVHRIGRTGRAGAKGEAVSLVCVDEHEMLKDIEKLIKQTLPREVIPGFEPDLNARAQPVQLRSGTGGHRNNSRAPAGAVVRVKTGGGGAKPRSAGPSGGGGGGGNRSGNAPRSAANHRSGGRGR